MTDLREPAVPSRVEQMRFAALMALAILLVGGLAFWDEERESASALDDFANEQATLASSVGAQLAAALTVCGAAPRSELLGPLARVEQPKVRVVLIQGPDRLSLWSTSGGTVVAPAVSQALAQSQASLRLVAAEAVALGLPPRTAFAGLTEIDAGPRGHWGIAVVTTALRERDRERRARWRVPLAVLCAAALVLTFGGVAWQRQRRQLELQRELAVAELARDRDQRLERLDRAATMLTLASGMAHELATPLGVIVGRAEQLAARNKDDERQAKNAQVILEQAERIHQVIRGFLHLARGGSPQMQTVTASEVIAGASALVEHRFAKAQVELTVTVAGQSAPIAGDRRLLEHAVVNLLLNACDACPPGGQVNLSDELEHDAVTFVVTDNGHGIAPADALRATEPFFTTKPQGTGLGLAIANEIAKSHRGALSIAPAQPRGTCARLRVPLSEGSSHAST